MILSLVVTSTSAQQADNYLRDEFDRVWSEYRQRFLAEHYEAALRFARRADELAAEVLRADDPLRADVAQGLGAALLRTGRAKASIPVLQEALMLSSQFDGRNALESVPVLIQLAEASASLGDQLKTKQYLFRGEQIVVQEFGANSLDHGEYALSAGTAVLDHLITSEVDRYFTDAHRIFDELLPVDHPYIATASYYLGYLKLLQRNAVDAIPHLQVATEKLPNDLANLDSMKALAFKHLSCANFTLSRHDHYKAAQRKLRNLANKPNGLIPIKRVAPYYPGEALAAGLQGFAEVVFTVSEKGRPVDIEITYRCNGPYFDAPTIEAVENFVYEIPLQDGKPTAHPNVKSRITYQLEP